MNATRTPVLCGLQDWILQTVGSSGVLALPLVGQPLGQLAAGQRWQVAQQLREIKLRVHIVPAASAGQDRLCSVAMRISDEEAVLAIENDGLYLSFRDIVLPEAHTTLAGMSP